MSGFEEFGFGVGDDNLGSKNRRFKAKQDEKYRISFVYWPGMEEGKPDLDAKTPKFLGVKRLYLQGVGYFIDHGPEWVKLAGQQSKMQVATLIALWPTDSKGMLDKSGFAENKFQVMPWIFSTDKYRNIEQNHGEFPLGQHDLTLHCTDAQYQKITISPCRENLFRKLYEKDPARANLIIEATKAAIPQLAGELAQDLTLDQIREKMSSGNGGGRPGGGPGGGGGGAGGAAKSDKEFDSMLDDILT